MDGWSNNGWEVGRVGGAMGGRWTLTIGGRWEDGPTKQVGLRMRVETPDIHLSCIFLCLQMCHA